jgi:hypothetical protein
MLLDKFEFIQPEKHSGFEPKFKAVATVKKENFEYVNLGSIIGDAPKCMIALYDYEKGGKIKKSNPRSWKKYIAKSASKYYPVESITEHLLNDLGKVFGLKMANSKLCRINEQIWFLSEYFLKDEFSLYHGADLFADHINDKQFVDEVQNDNKVDDQDYFTLQLVKQALENSFQDESKAIFQDFIKMIIYDGIVGNNDRHSYNWGVVKSIRVNTKTCFSPIYDTARGFFWNSTEKQVVEMLKNTKKSGENDKIKKYVVNSRPKIGWEGKKSLSHLDLLKLIFHNEFGISKENFVNLLKEENLSACINVIEKDFKDLFSSSRRQLIIDCLHLRFKLINESFN